MTKEKKAIEILMEEAGYFWCVVCEEWLKVIDDDIESHFRSRHF